VTSPPTGILPPSPIGQSQAASAATKASNGQYRQPLHVPILDNSLHPPRFLVQHGKIYKFQKTGTSPGKIYKDCESPDSFVPNPLRKPTRFMPPKVR
jgi:hypothetical protein